MLSFFKKKAAPVAVPKCPPPPYKPGMTLEYLRNRDDAVVFARQLLRTPQFQDMLAVLHHELPLNSTIEAVMAHKRVLRMIELCADHANKQNEEVETTFGAEKEFPDLSTTNTTDEQE